MSARSLARWPAPPDPGAEIAFLPARILLQDFTGVPAVVDLAAMRSALDRARVDPGRMSPLIPVDLVIDHSVQVDVFGALAAYERNIAMEYERNAERYALLRWTQDAARSGRLSARCATGIATAKTADDAAPWRTSGRHRTGGCQTLLTGRTSANSRAWLATWLTRVRKPPVGSSSLPLGPDFLRELARSAHAPATRTALCSNWPGRPGNAPAHRSSEDAFGRARPARSGGPVTSTPAHEPPASAASSQ